MKPNVALIRSVSPLEGDGALRALLVPARQHYTGQLPHQAAVCAAGWRETAGAEPA